MAFIRSQCSSLFFSISRRIYKDLNQLKNPNFVSIVGGPRNFCKVSKDFGIFGSRLPSDNDYKKTWEKQLSEESFSWLESDSEENVGWPDHSSYSDDKLKMNKEENEEEFDNDEETTTDSEEELMSDSNEEKMSDNDEDNSSSLTLTKSKKHRIPTPKDNTHKYLDSIFEREEVPDDRPKIMILRELVNALKFGKHSPDEVQRKIKFKSALRKMETYLKLPDRPQLVVLNELLSSLSKRRLNCDEKARRFAYQRALHKLETGLSPKESPKLATLKEHLSVMEKGYLTAGKHARRLAFQNALKKLQKGPDGRYINVFEVVTDLDVLIWAFEEVISEPVYDDLKYGGPRKLNMEYFKDLQERLRNGNYKFTPPVRLRPRSRYVPKRKFLRYIARKGKIKRGPLSVPKFT